MTIVYNLKELLTSLSVINDLMRRTQVLMTLDVFSTSTWALAVYGQFEAE